MGLGRSLGLAVGLHSLGVGGEQGGSLGLSHRAFKHEKEVERKVETITGEKPDQVQLLGRRKTRTGSGPQASAKAAANAV